MESNTCNLNNLVERAQELKITRDETKKRSDCLEWDEYFMAIAFMNAKRSKDPSTNVGACIVNEENIVLAQGYNGMPEGCSDDDFPWGTTSANPLENKHMYVCHAVINAILNKDGANIKGCRIYTNLFPCNECAKMIIQSRISEVIYKSGKNMDSVEGIASIRMLNAAGVKYRQLILKVSKVIIDFTEVPLYPRSKQNPSE